MKATLAARLSRLGTTYRSYLTSRHWQEVRRRYRKSHLPQACLGCESTRYELHHRSYTRLGCELLTDLIPLCRDCHSRVHAYEEAHPTQIGATHKILRVLFHWTRAQMHAKFAPFDVRFGQVGPGIPLGGAPGMTRRQHLRELRRQDPTNPAYWTPKQKRRALRRHPPTPTAPVSVSRATLPPAPANAATVPPWEGETWRDPAWEQAAKQGRRIGG